MKNEVLFQHEFVEFMPPKLEPSIVYVSIEYSTASHLCACGCGMKVVTPISPTDWQLTFDGDTVSLYPSIGNWSYPCRSHYFIRRNRAVWAGDMSKAEIARGRAYDRMVKDRNFEQFEHQDSPILMETKVEKRQSNRKWWQRMLRL